MQVINKATSPLDWHSTFSKIIAIENYFFFGLNICVLVNGLSLIFLSFDNMSCRPEDPGIQQQFQATTELRDLNAYVDLLCATDIKTKHIPLYIVTFVIIVSLIAYGIILTVPLKRIKSYYFICYKEYPKGKIIKRNGLDEFNFDSAIHIWFIIFVILKIVLSIILVIVPIIVLYNLKYTYSREFFFPYANKCGPELRWDSIRNEDFIIGDYLCHFNSEWTVFLLMICSDIFNGFLLLLLLIQLLNAIFYIAYWRITSKDTLWNFIIDLKDDALDKKTYRRIRRHKTDDQKLS